MKLLKSGLSTVMGVVMTMTMFAAPVASGSFSSDQKAAIQNIVKEYLLANPEILVDVSRELEKRQRDMMQKKAESAISENRSTLLSDKSPIIGNAKGSVAIVEFFDYQCVHCRHMTSVVDEVVSGNKDIKIIYKELPIFGDVSEFASRAALASAKQNKYNEFHKALMTTNDKLSQDAILQIAKDKGVNVDQMKKDMESQEIKDQISQNMDLARKIQIMGTPAFVVININAKDKPSKFIGGATTVDNLKEMIKSVQ